MAINTDHTREKIKDQITKGIHKPVPGRPDRYESPDGCWVDSDGNIVGIPMSTAKEYNRRKQCIYQDHPFTH